MNDAVNVIEVCEAFEDGNCDLGYDLDVDRAYPLVDTVERTLVHKLHTDADVGVGQERAVKRNDVLRVAVVHDLQLTQDLLAHGWLCVNEDDLPVNNDTNERVPCRSGTTGQTVPSLP